MDWLKDALEVLLAPSIAGIFTWLFSKLVTAGVAALKTYIKAISNAKLQAFINLAAGQVVLYVQQKYAELSNTEKFEKAMEVLETKVDDFTEKLGLGREIVSKDDLEVAIEAAVKSLKDSWGDVNP